MLDLRTQPNPGLLYLVAIFAIEPAHETRGLHGSLGRVGWDGDLEWHVEVVQARRVPEQYSSGAALAVVYLRIRERESPNMVYEEDVQNAFALLEGLIAPKEWASEQPLSLKVLEAGTYRGTGRALGGSVYANMIWGAGAGSLGRDGIEFAQLDQRPELRLAIRFYTRGISAASERFLPDACINYARSIECIVGSTSDRPALRAECARLGLDAARILDFLDKARGRYAIGHALDKVRAGRRKLKDLPTPEIERAARDLAKNAIAAHIRLLPPFDHQAEQRRGIRYFGLPPVKTNLPLAREVLWAKDGPWEQAAPGMAPDLVPLTDLARQFRVPPSRLRSLVKRHLLRSYRQGRRLVVSSVMYEFYMAFANESARDYSGNVFESLGRASADSGVPLEELRALVRQRRVHGWLRHRTMGEAVAVDSLRYYIWRQRRRDVVAELNLPNQLNTQPAQRSRYRRRDQGRRRT